MRRWKGFYIPPIPHKKTFGNKNRNFIKYRWYFLNRFIQALTRNDYLWKSKELSMFLDQEVSVETTIGELPEVEIKDSSEDLRKWMGLGKEQAEYDETKASIFQFVKES